MLNLLKGFWGFWVQGVGVLEMRVVQGMKEWSHMYYSQFLKGGYIWDYIGEYYRAF